MKKKTVLITGVSRGIGKRLAFAFSENGWDVSGCYKNISPDFAILGAKLMKADITNLDDVRKLITSVVDRYNTIDCVVNNASITASSTISKMTDEMWKSVIETNLSGTFYVIKEVLKTMIKQKGGSIINIASISAFKSYIGAANYSASKAGVVALTKTAAREAGRFDVTVNAIFPGFHSATNMGGNTDSTYVDAAKKESVLNTTTDIKELTDFVVFLAQIKTVSGQIFNFDSRLI